MFTLIIGGSSSGKSKYAENLVTSLEGRRIYLATMEPWDSECQKRIARHRDMRKDSGFETLECYRNLASLSGLEGSNILLEDLGNLTANELYTANGGGVDAVLKGIDSLLFQCTHLTVVTNEVFSGGDRYEGDTETYLYQLGRIHRILSAKADRVVEVLSGYPNFLKGGEMK